MAAGTVVITGGSRGIGLASAEVMGAAGWSVAITGTDERRLADAEAHLRSLDIRVCALRFPVESESAWAPALDTAERSLGPIAALVCNAGISPRREGRKISFEETDTETWARTLDVNLWGVLHGFRIVSRRFIERGVGGSLVAVASLAARARIPAVSSYYSASKTAVVGLVRGAAFDLGRYDIRVNAVAPGRIDTDMTRAAGDEVNRGFLPEIALGRLGGAREVGEAIEFLCSPRASYITGVCLDVTGGWYMG